MPPRGDAVDDDASRRRRDRPRSGSGTTSAASRTTRSAQPPTFVSAATGCPTGGRAAGARRARRRRRGRSRGRTGTAAGRSTCRGASAARRTRRRSRSTRTTTWPGLGLRQRAGADLRAISGSTMPGRTISVAFMVDLASPWRYASLELLTKVLTCYDSLSSARRPRRPPARPPPPRDRFRTQMREEIKDAALRQIADGRAGRASRSTPSGASSASPGRRSTATSRAVTRC